MTLAARLTLEWEGILDYGVNSGPNKNINMKYFLSIDYVLSSWFSRTPDKIIPGTAFLFLNKVAFIWASLFFAVTGIFEIKMNLGFYVGILVLGGGVIMYGLQKKLETLIQNLNFKKTLNIPKHKIIEKRLLGLFYLASSFAAIFVIVSILN